MKMLTTWHSQCWTHSRARLTTSTIAGLSTCSWATILSPPPTRKPLCVWKRESSTMVSGVLESALVAQLSQSVILLCIGCHQVSETACMDHTIWHSLPMMSTWSMTIMEAWLTLRSQWSRTMHSRQTNSFLTRWIITSSGLSNFKTSAISNPITSTSTPWKRAALTKSAGTTSITVNWMQSLQQHRSCSLLPPSQLFHSEEENKNNTCWLHPKS